MPANEEHIVQWIDACRNNDRLAQEKVYKHFYPLLMPVCMSYVTNNDDAIDIYNRSLLKAFTSLNQFNGSGAVGAWLRRIIVNTAIDFIRKQEKLKFQTSIEDAIHVGIDADTVSHMTSEEILSLFRYLPPAQRLVLNLYIVEGYTHKEIADQLKISVGTSKWHLNQGRKVLQEKIYEMGIISR